MVSTNNLTCNDDVEALKGFIPEKKISITDYSSAEKSLIKNGAAQVTKSKGNKEKKGSSFKQVSAALLANIATINTGLTFGFSAVANPQLQDVNSVIPVDNAQASWIASISALGTPCGCILSSYLTDKMGRKRTLILTEVPAIIGWVMIATAPSIWWIYIGRLLTGFASGMVGAPSRVYTAEVTQPHLRGILSALASVGTSLGIAIVYLLGALCSWQMSAWICALVPIFALVSSAMLPESPSWLVISGKNQESLKNLKRLRGRTFDVHSEMKSMLEFSERHNSCAYVSPKEKFKMLLEPASLRPFFIVSVYFLLFQLSGTNPITFYSVTIFEDAAITMDKYSATVFAGITRLVFTILGSVLMLRCGRRSLTFVSSIGCGITSIALGLYIYMVEEWKNSNMEPYATWVPVLAVYLHTASCTIGFVIVPWVMIGELFPSKVRGMLGGFAACLCHTFVFVAVKTYPLIRQWAKFQPFFIYGAITLLGTVFFYIFLPETKGKTLQDIEDYFTQPRRPIVKNNNNNINNNNNSINNC